MQNQIPKIIHFYILQIQKGQKQTRKVVSELLERLQDKNDCKDKDVQIKIHAVSQFLPNPLKAQEFLKKFVLNLINDQVMFNALGKVVNDEDISCKDCNDTVVSYKAHPIKLCKTGNIRSNFQKLGTFGNLKVLPFQNHHFLLDQTIYVDFILILVKETMIFECKIPPCIFRPIWPKIKISIKVIKYRYVGFI